MKVLIVGGGLGGLTLAVASARQGMAPVVIERSQVFGEVGAGIQLSPNATRVLDGLEISPLLEASAVRPETVEIRHHRTGLMLARTPLGEAAKGRYGSPYWHIHRADLHAALRDAAQAAGATFHLGVPVVGLTQDANEVALRLDDGSTIRGDVAVGCDGVRSTVRAALFGPEAPRFTGQVAWRALIPTERLPKALTRPQATVWIGPRRHVVHYPARARRLVNFIGVVERDWRQESWSERGDPKELAEDFQGWHRTVRTLIDAADHTFRWALYDRDPLPVWSLGRVTLLGDAAHPMLPFMAQAAAMAIEDASVLAKNFAVRPSIEAAIADYVDRRRDRTAKVQLASRATAEAFHLSHILDQVRAYAGLALTSRLHPQRMMAQQDWLYGG